MAARVGSEGRGESASMGCGNRVEMAFFHPVSPPSPPHHPKLVIHVADLNTMMHSYAAGWLYYMPSVLQQDIVLEVPPLIHKIHCYLRGGEYPRAGW